jgi:hypothetical protein
MMAIFPGMYSGASFGWKISVPIMFPMLKATKVRALTVLFFV